MSVSLNTRMWQREARLWNILTSFELKIDIGLGSNSFTFFLFRKLFWGPRGRHNKCLSLENDKVAKKQANVRKVEMRRTKLHYLDSRSHSSERIFQNIVAEPANNNNRPHFYSFPVQKWSKIGQIVDRYFSMFPFKIIKDWANNRPHSYSFSLLQWSKIWQIIQVGDIFVVFISLFPLQKWPKIGDPLRL